MDTATRTSNVRPRPWQEEFESISSSGSRSWLYHGKFRLLEDIQTSYEGISDSASFAQHFEGVHPPRPRVEFSNLFHVTDKASLINISKEGFKGGEPRCSWYQQKGLFFSWWAPEMSIETKDQIQNHYQQVLNENGYETEPETTTKLGISPVFKPEESLYGNFKMSVSLKELEESYKQLCNCQEVAYKMFGTVTFAKETMYVVVVCDKEDATFSDLEDATDTHILKREGDMWYWVPQSTGGDHIFKYGWRRWDHVCFAYSLKRDQRLLENKDWLAEGSSIKCVDNYWLGGRRPLKGDFYTTAGAKDVLKQLRKRRKRKRNRSEEQTDSHNNFQGGN